MLHSLAMALLASAAAARSTLQMRSYDNFPAQASDKIPIALYYESYCPFCQNFWVEQLAPSFECTSQMMDLTLVPYGNARYTGNKAPYKYTCQHGPDECVGNLFETALLHIANFTTAFNVITCLETTLKAAELETQKKCTAQFGIDFDEVTALANSDKGNELQFQYAQQTGQLVPAHNYVPWLTLNNTHDESTQTKMQSNFLGYVCLMYQGDKPDCCDDALLH